MKKLLVSVLFVLSCFGLFSQTLETNTENWETSKSMFSLHVGFASDLNGGQGYSVFIKSATFFGEGPFYYGFGSLVGDFSTTKESFFETGILVGYNGDLSNSNLYYDLFLDFLITGGRINQETSLYQAEAPALHLGLSLGFPASSDIDGALSIAPVIRPYNMQTQTWDFSRSYINLSLSLQVKSFFLGERQSWPVSHTTIINKEKLL
jgi:hypothetical protein